MKMNKINKYDIILIKDKNLNILSPRSARDTRVNSSNLLNSRRLTKFPHVYELARRRIALSEH